MSESERKIVREYVSEGVKITEYSDGSTSFIAVNESKTNKQPDERSWWQKVKDWWNDSPVTPYVGVRDLSDPFDKLKENPTVHDGSGSKLAVEVGINIKF